MIPNFQNSSNEIIGRSLSLPAHGWVGARATSSLAAHFAKRNTKFGGGGKARAGKNSFPPTPSFLPARAEKFLFLPSEARQSNFALRIFVKKSSDFVQGVEPSSTKRV